MLKSRKGVRNYNISKNRLNDETWDFGDVPDENRSGTMMKLQSSLKKFDVRSDQDWARKGDQMNGIQTTIGKKQKR